MGDGAESAAAWSSGGGAFAVDDGGAVLDDLLSAAGDLAPATSNRDLPKDPQLPMPAEKQPAIVPQMQAASVSAPVARSSERAWGTRGRGMTGKSICLREENFRVHRAR